jgi:glucoamylase
VSDKLKTGKAPGHPGAGSHWESSRKTGVGQACNFVSRVWFTVGDGILNEIYYPRIDQPCTKDCGFIVTDGATLFSEEKTDTDSEIRWADEGVPALMVTNTHRGGLYRLHKEIIVHPASHVVLQRTRLEVLQGNAPDYRLYALLVPHLGDEGVHNTACFGSWKGVPMLFAESKKAALALACSTGWKGRSVGFVGHSDGWQDLSRHKELRRHYDLAKDGNVALTGEVHLEGDGSFILAIGFGEYQDEAAFRTRTGLAADFDETWKRYVAEWTDWHESLGPVGNRTVSSRLFRRSAAILRIHEATDFPGGRVASLSVPWGEVQNQEHAAGYHAVWARDGAQSALGLLACGARDDVRRTLNYLSHVQEADGHWPQAMWVDGSTYWKAIQIDSIAAPLLLFEIARQGGLFSHGADSGNFWPMVRRTAEFICRNGPVSEQDRWERNSGFSVYTLSLAIAGLVIAAQAAREKGEAALAEYLLDTADAWNAQVENWTYTKESEMARSLGLPGVYCRIVPADETGRPQFDGVCPLENSQTNKKVPAREIVSPDVWGLVRYGLRSPDDERVRQTTAAIDATLKTETPAGPVWHRYNEDGYGETQTGEPFSKEGVGRGWPLLVGERAHYELAQGHVEEAKRLFDALENFAGEAGLLSEQVWDAPDLPKKGLFLGKATGSARPLAWTHAEHLQLLRSLADNRVFTCPRIVAERYVERTPPRHTPWRFNLQTPYLVRDTILRIEMTGPAFVSWTISEKKGEAYSVQSPVGFILSTCPRKTCAEVRSRLPSTTTRMRSGRTSVTTSARPIKLAAFAPAHICTQLFCVKVRDSAKSDFFPHPQ